MANGTAVTFPATSGPHHVSRYILFYNSSFFCTYAFFILFSTKINVTTDEIDINASIEDMNSLLYPLLSKARSNNGTIYTRKAASTEIIIHIVVTNAKRLVNLIP